MIPVACYRLISNNLTVIAGYFPLPGQIKQPQTDSSIIGGISLPLPVRIMAYPLTWLTLITITTGMCLMNVYEFVKVRPAPQSFHNKRRNRWIRIFLFPPVSSLKCYFSTHYLKIFFKFLIAAFTDFATI